MFLLSFLNLLMKSKHRFLIMHYWLPMPLSLEARWCPLRVYRFSTWGAPLSIIFSSDLFWFWYFCLSLTKSRPVWWRGLPRSLSILTLSLEFDVIKADHIQGPQLTHLSQGWSITLILTNSAFVKEKAGVIVNSQIFLKGLLN